MIKIFKIRCKSNGKFWKPRKRIYGKQETVIFDKIGKSFANIGSAKNSFIAHTKDFGTGTVRSENPQLDPNDFEIVEFEVILKKVAKYKLK